VVDDGFGGVAHGLLVGGKIEVAGETVVEGEQDQRDMDEGFPLDKATVHEQDLDSIRQYLTTGMRPVKLSRSAFRRLSQQVTHFFL